MSSVTPVGAGAVLAVVIAGCARPNAVVDVNGQCADVFHASVCTWARMQGQNVVAVGLTVPVAAIDSAPAEEGPMTWPPVAAAVLQIPESAQAQSGLTHFTMFWEATGHPPAAYLTPHFDFHFYTIAPADRSAIDCSDTSKPSALPAAYALPDVTLPTPMAQAIGVSTLVGLCVPQMGMHSLPATELADTTLFRGTMVIGYYAGRPIFIEPMITRAMLEDKRSFDLPIPDIPGMGADHPRTFHAEYDAGQNAYQFVFSNFRPTT